MKNQVYCLLSYGTTLNKFRLAAMAGTHDIPSNVSAEAGEVLVEGPQGIVVSWTPAAALKTADRLRAASATAKQQQSTERGE